MILSHLSQRIVDIIVNLQDDSDQVWTLRSLLNDLLEWGNKPEYLVPMAYRWCSAISKKIRECRGDEPTSEDLSSTDYHNHNGHILSLSLAIAFRHIGSKHVILYGRLSHTPHDEWMLDTISTRGDDDAIADAVYVGIVDEQANPSGSCTHRLLKLTERGWPFSPRLRRSILRFVRDRGYSEFREAELELVCLLNNLEVSVGEAGNAGRAWTRLLIALLLTRIGQGRLSSHYWLLLGNLISVFPEWHFADDRQTDLMKSLEGAQDWEKLETWMLVIWWSGYYSDPVPIQDIERSTLMLFRQRPSAIPKFEGFFKDHTESSVPPLSLFDTYRDVLRRVCDQSQAEQSCLGSPS
jgi:hypothetical protein